MNKNRALFNGYRTGENGYRQCSTLRARAGDDVGYRIKSVGNRVEAVGYRFFTAGDAPSFHGFDRSVTGAALGARELAMGKVEPCLDALTDATLSFRRGPQMGQSILFSRPRTETSPLEICPHFAHQFGCRNDIFFQVSFSQILLKLPLVFYQIFFLDFFIIFKFGLNFLNSNSVTERFLKPSRSGKVGNKTRLPSHF